MRNDKQILMDSPEAASLQTVTGWVSADGRFWGKDERAARYGGCTHRKCEECGTVITKNWLYCPHCKSRRARERFLEMPVVEWDGITPLCLLDDDKYFFEEDDIICYAEEHEVKVSDLPLVLCVPHHPSEVNANDLFEDYLPDEMGVEDVTGSGPVLEAIAALNTALKAASPFSWMPGKKRVVLELEKQ